jgi:hypothetical protein
MRTFTFLAVIFLLFLISCDLINSEEPVPSFLRIESIDLQTTGNEGSALQKIEDAWVFVDGQDIGIFGIPSDVPIYSTGPTEVLVFAGIRENGIRATPEIFPFVERMEFSADLQEGESIPVNLTTEYKSNITFQFIEDFEAAHRIGTDVDGDPETEISIITSSEAFEGRSGVMKLTRDNPLGVVATSDAFVDLPIDGSTIYLEMHYKNDVPLEVGLLGRLDDGSQVANLTITLFETDEWNKIYINFTPDVTGSQLREYQITFGGIIPVGDTSIQEAFIYLDNIKLIHF